MDQTIHSKFTESKVFELLERQENVSYVPGGCSYNTMRVFNWLIKDVKIGKVGVLGSIGKDSYGAKYKDLLKSEDIQYIFEQIDNVNTGVCAVYCHDRDRGHVTDLGASIMISPKFIKENLVSSIFYSGSS